MPKTVRIAPIARPQGRQSITFFLAIGAVRQLCCLQTTFQTSNQAYSYLHKHRTELEHAARERFVRGEIEDGVINLTML